jgi:hypothetical protein
MRPAPLVGAKTVVGPARGHWSHIDLAKTGDSLLPKPFDEASLTLPLKLRYW